MIRRESLRCFQPTHSLELDVRRHIPVQQYGKSVRKRLHEREDEGHLFRQVAHCAADHRGIMEAGVEIACQNPFVVSTQGVLFSNVWWKYLSKVSFKES